MIAGTQEAFWQLFNILKTGVIYSSRVPNNSVTNHSFLIYFPRIARLCFVVLCFSLFFQLYQFFSSFIQLLLVSDMSVVKKTPGYFLETYAVIGSEPQITLKPRLDQAETRCVQYHTQSSQNSLRNFSRNTSLEAAELFILQEQSMLEITSHQTAGTN